MSRFGHPLDPNPTFAVRVRQISWPGTVLDAANRHACPMTDLVRQEIVTETDTLVVKVGTRVLTGDDGRLDERQVENLAEQLHVVAQGGRRVALVSSGAVGAGMGVLGLADRPQSLPQLQAAAAVGQAFLVQIYDRSLRKHGRHASQILLTAGDFDDRQRYLNVRNTLLTLFEWDAVPIINENDTLSVEELQTTFGDNDRLAALVTNLLRAPLLVILSDVEGLYDGDPQVAGSQVIPTVTQIDNSIWSHVRDGANDRSRPGKGGMASKLNAAAIATGAGENVIIASGRRPDTLQRILAGETVGTLFLAQGTTVKARKRWIGYTVQPRGYLVLDDGARRAVSQQGRSLLPIGITDCGGEFDRGDVVAIRDTSGNEFARGLTNYPCADLLRIKGLRTDAIASVLGSCPYEEVIHRDNLLVTG